MKFLTFTEREKSGILLLCAITLIAAVVIRVSIRTTNAERVTTLTQPDTLNIQQTETQLKLDKKDEENLILYNF